MEIFYIMMVVTFTQLHEFVKTDQTELLKRMAFTVCKQYFNIPGFKNKGNYHQAQAKRGETGWAQPTGMGWEYMTSIFLTSLL